jgi:hypothetical protein
VQECCTKVLQKLAPEILQNVPPDHMSVYFKDRNVTKPVGRILQALVLLGREHFIGPLSEHLHNTIQSREVVSAFWIVVNPVRVLENPLNTPVKQAVLQASTSFTARVEEVVRMLHGRTTIQAAIFIPAVLEVLHTYAEYKSAFETWVDLTVVDKYDRMRRAIILLRSAYMECRDEADPLALNLLNDMMYIMYFMDLLDSLYPGRFHGNNGDDNNNLIPY